MSNIPHTNLHQITASQFAVDGEVKQSQITDLLRDLKPDANCPDLLQLEWWLLACQLALVPWALFFTGIPILIPTVVCRNQIMTLGSPKADPRRFERDGNLRHEMDAQNVFICVDRAVF